MSSKFFYDLSLKQFELAYNSYTNITSNINEHIKYVLTLAGINVGFCYFIYEKDLKFLLIYNILSLFCVVIVISIGIYSIYPKDIGYINSVNAYKQHFDLEASPEYQEKVMAIISLTIAENVNNLRNLCNRKSIYLFYMQIFFLIGIFIFGLSIIDFIF